MPMCGTELRMIRKKLGLTLQQFAPQLGIHWNSLARFERGEMTISGPVEKLARLLLQLAQNERKEKPQRKR